MGEVLPDNFVLSDKNIADVQKLLPNRNGMTTEHALWPGAGMGKRPPDVRAVACMKDCGPAPTLASFLPDFARDAHGNLSEQNRAVGAQVGADTTKPAAPVAPGSAARPAAAPPAKPASAPAAAPASAAPVALLQKHTCVACHGMESKIVGPGFREIAKKYARQRQCGRVPRRQDQGWQRRRLGQRADAAAGARRIRCEIHRAVAGRWHEQVGYLPT